MGVDSYQALDINSLIPKLSREHTALVEINTTSVGSSFFILLPNTEFSAKESKRNIITLFINDLTTDSLNKILWNHDNKEESWLGIYPMYKKERRSWLKNQELVLKKIGDLVWPKLDSLLQYHKISKLVFVPNGKLFLFPLHATPFSPIDGEILTQIYPLQRYSICYSPSAHVYEQLIQKHSQKTRICNALFIGDPDDNLGAHFSNENWFSKKLSKHNIQLKTLRYKDITIKNILENVGQSNLIHYHGHGYFNWFKPEESGLQMYSPGKPKILLSVNQIQKDANLSQANLVVLSACETGMTDILKDAFEDQYIGLPASFLRSGAKAVIGSLWQVPNTETSLLFSRFYLELFNEKENFSPAEALRRAQLWLMRAKPEAVEEAEYKYLGLEEGTKKLNLTHSQSPYSHPENWAGFYIVGDGFSKLK
ncbi:CHAT domain-containing protein [candidate division KSB1 bacterium]|nr:CHAT domain-containing protein [candidate division KSB1 bacterium]